MSRVSWTDEEVVALKRGVGKYGAGNWAPILLDDEFGPILFARTNVNIKDKWRWLEHHGLSAIRASGLRPATSSPKKKRKADSKADAKVDTKKQKGGKNNKESNKGKENREVGTKAKKRPKDVRTINKKKAATSWQRRKQTARVQDEQWEYETEGTQQGQHRVYRRNSANHWATHSTNQSTNYSNAYGYYDDIGEGGSEDEASSVASSGSGLDLLAQAAALDVVDAVNGLQAGCRPVHSSACKDEQYWGFGLFCREGDAAQGDPRKGNKTEAARRYSPLERVVMQVKAKIAMANQFQHHATDLKVNIHGTTGEQRAVNAFLTFVESSSPAGVVDVHRAAFCG